MHLASSPVAKLLLTMAALSSALFSLKQIDRRTVTQTTGIERLFLDRGLRLLDTLHHSPVYEDLAYIALIQQTTDKSLDVATLESYLHLEPRIENFYLVSCDYLLFELRRADDCLKVNLTGIRRVPTSWRIPMLQGFIYQDRLNQPREAGVMLAVAASRSGAPTWLRELSVKLARSGGVGSRQEFERWLDFVLSNVGNDPKTRRLLHHMKG